MPLVAVAAVLEGDEARCDTWSLTSDFRGDSLGLLGGKAVLGYQDDVRSFGSLGLYVQGLYLSGVTISGIPGGTYYRGGGILRHVFPLDSFRFTTDGGFDDLSSADSWRVREEIAYQPSFAKGATIRLDVESRLLNGSWFTRNLRSTPLHAGFLFASDTDYGEAGFIADFRSAGPLDPTPVAVTPTANRLDTAYAYWTHRFVPWLAVGPLFKWSDAEHNFHQPTDSTSKGFVYADYPYATPNQEIAVAGIVALFVGPAHLSVSWPVYSTGLYRSEISWDTATYLYRDTYMAKAEVKAGVSFHLSRKWQMGLDALAESRPYAPGQWFTSQSWYQFGGVLSVFRTSSDGDHAH